MKKLSRDDVNRFENLKRDLGAASELFNLTKRQYTDALEAANTAFGIGLKTYNDAVTALNAFRDDIHSSMEEYVDSKSDKWKEGETGQEYCGWMEKWDTEFDSIDFNPEADFETTVSGLDEITGSVSDTIQTLEDLPVEL